MTDRPIPDPRDIWQQGEGQGAPQRRAGRAHQAASPRRPAAGQHPPRSGWRAAALWGGLVLACLGVAAVVFLFVASPLEAVRDRLIERVNARIGGKLAVAGPASLSLFPRPVVSFSDVAVLASEGGKETPARDRAVARGRGRPVVAPAAPAAGGTAHPPPARHPAQRRRPGPPQLGDRRQAQDATRHGRCRRRRQPARLLRSRRRIDGRRPRRKRSPAGPCASSTPPCATATSARATQYEISALNLELAADDREGPVAVEGSLTWRGVELRLSGTASPLRTSWPASRRSSASRSRARPSRPPTRAR